MGKQCVEELNEDDNQLKKTNKYEQNQRRQQDDQDVKNDHQEQQSVKQIQHEMETEDKEQGNIQQLNQPLIEYKLITNDGNPQSLKWLIDLKNIFTAQLPNMPKKYIVKLMFDRHHKSIIVLRKQTNKVIGGVCFREFKSQGFSEIAFLAIIGTQQVKGFGSQLMGQFKTFSQASGEIKFAMTYADNQAVGYFKKQGFEIQGSLLPEGCEGIIKHYDGGTLMYSKIHPYIDYEQLKEIVTKQKEILIDRIKEISLNLRLFKGATVKQLLEQAIETNRYINSQKPAAINPHLIPGIKESGWRETDSIELSKQKRVPFQAQCYQILECLKRHKQSWPFLNPVSRQEVPNYYEVIREPVDISMISAKLGSQKYSNKAQFAHDVRQMFKNAKIFNGPGNTYYEAAEELEILVEPLLNILRDHIDAPSQYKKPDGRATYQWKMMS